MKKATVEVRRWKVQTFAAKEKRVAVCVNAFVLYNFTSRKKTNSSQTLKIQRG